LRVDGSHPHRFLDADLAIPKAFRHALLLYAALASGTVWSSEPLSPETLPLSRGRVFDENGGGALFTNVCAGCHQPDGRGAVGAGAYPALADNKELASADYVIELMLKGQRGMPPVGQMMSDQQIADVINYVRTHFGNAYGDDVSPADVEAARRGKGSVP
jgi:mono/diheme cytochrome c family protein